MPPPTYRERLRREGLALAAVGAVGSAALLAAHPQVTRMPLNTIGQLAALAAGLGGLGPRLAAKAIERARPVALEEVGSGEPTPLWHIPIPVVAFAVIVSVVGEQALAALPLPDRVQAAPGWDAALRVTAGSAIFGLYQAFVLERHVARAERRLGRSFYRLPGSRIGRGSVLGAVAVAARASSASDSAEPASMSEAPTRR